MDSTVALLKNRPLSFFSEQAQKKWVVFFAVYVLLTVLTVFVAFECVLFRNDAAFGTNAITFTALLLLLVTFFAFLLGSWKEHPERVFLLVSVPAGVAFAFFVLPNQVPDERWHIYRAFDLKLTGVGTTVPAMLASMPTSYSDLCNCLLEEDGWHEMSYMDRDLTGYYVHLYLLPSIAIRLLAVFQVNPYAAIIVGRLVNGLLFCIVGFLILKRIPIAKTLVLLYLLNPMLIQQEFSLSADAMVNAISLAYIAYLLWMKFDRHFKRSNWIILAILLVGTCVSKFAYAPLALLLLLLVPSVVSSASRRRVIYITVAVFCAVVAGVVVATYSGDTYRSMFELIRNPQELFTVLLKSTYELGPLWVKEFAGMILGALNVTVWEPCFWAYCLMLLFAAVFNLGETHSFSRAEKIFLVALTALMSVMILLVFREWTLTVDMRSDVIMGMQGRYLLPFYVLPLIALVTPRASLHRENCLVLYGWGLACIYVLDVLFIVLAFK